MRNTPMKVTDFGQIAITPAKNGIMVQIGTGGNNYSTGTNYVFTDLEEFFEWISQTILEKEEM